MVAGCFQVFGSEKNFSVALRTVLRIETRQHTMDLTAAFNADVSGK
jgi:hypothetical protein